MPYIRAIERSPLPGCFVWVIRGTNKKPESSPCMAIWDKGTGATLFREAMFGAVWHDVTRWRYAVPPEPSESTESESTEPAES